MKKYGRKVMAGLLSAALLITSVYVPEAEEIIDVDEISEISEAVEEEAGIEGADIISLAKNEVFADGISSQDEILEDIIIENTLPEDTEQGNDIELIISEWEWDEEYPQLEQKNDSEDWVLRLPERSEDGYDPESIKIMLPAAVQTKLEGTDGWQEFEIADWICDEYVQNDSGIWPVSGTFVFSALLGTGYLCEDIAVCVEFIKSVVETESESEINTEEYSEPESEINTEEYSEPESEINTEEYSEPESEINTEEYTEPESEINTEEYSEPESEINTEEYSEPESEINTEEHSEPESETDVEPVIESESIAEFDEIPEENAGELLAAMTNESESETESESESEMIIVPGGTTRETEDDLDGYGNAIEVDSAQKLKTVFEKMDKDYVLTQDIDMSEYGEINTSNSYFTGSIDGAGHTISNLSVKIDEGTNAGLFAGMNGSIQNVNFTNVTIQAEPGGGDFFNIGILGGTMCGGKVVNCNFSGKIDVVERASCIRSYVGGITGFCEEGYIENCEVNVDISTSSTSGTFTGGVAGYVLSGNIVNCDYNGKLEVSQLGNYAGSDSSWQAFGIAYCDNEESYSANCTVKGEIYVNTDNGYASAMGICTANHSESSAKVHVETIWGDAYAFGAYMGNDLINTGEIKTVSNSGSISSAVGIGSVTVGANKASVTVMSTVTNKEAYAFGMQNCSRTINEGNITAEAKNGDAAAFGGGGAEKQNINLGEVRSSIFGSGYAYAVGIQGTDIKKTGFDAGDVIEEEDSYEYEAENCTNVGSVNANCRSGKAVAYGILDCAYSENTGSVNVEYFGDKKGQGSAWAAGGGGKGVINRGSVNVKVYSSITQANARGIQNGQYNINEGTVTAYGAASAAIAIGINHAVESDNRANISAKSEGPEGSKDGCAYAYGVYNDAVNSSNSGEILAESKNASAYAYGAASEGGTSTGFTRAVTSYMKENFDSEGVREVRIGWAFASKSTVTEVAYPGFSCRAGQGEEKTIYYLAVSKLCTDHREMKPCFVVGPSWIDKCFVYCGAARSDSCAGDEIQVPEQEEGEGDPNELQMIYSGLYRQINRKDTLVSRLYYACGSFSFSSWISTSELSSPEATCYDRLYMRILVETLGNKTLKNTGLTVILPDGLSFSQTQVVNKKEYTIDQVSAVTEFWIPDPIYLLYSEAYYDTDEMQISYTVHLEGGEIYSEKQYLASVRMVDLRLKGKKNMACLRRGADSALAEELYKWNASMFESDNMTYNKEMSLLAAYFSEMMEDGDKQRLKSRLCHNMKELGFSKTQYGGSSNGFEEEYLCATKKIVTSTGKVRTIVLLALQGSDSVMDWIANLSYDGEISEHLNFVGCARNNYRYFTDYCKKIGLDIEDNANRILITGHSRGGAIANYIAHMIIEPDGTPRSLKNLYCYTYAAANHSNPKNYNAPEYNNIYNIINYTDAVPFVPGDLTKYGISLVFNTDETYAENPIIMLRIQALRSLDSLVSIASLVSAVILALKLNLGKNHSMTEYINAVKTMEYLDYMDNDAVINARLMTRENMLRALREVENCVNIAEQISRTSVRLARSAARKKSRVRVTVRCPVDVQLLNTDGTVVCEIKNNEIVSCTSEDISVLISGDQKELWLPDTSAYCVKVTGYDTGTVDYSVITSDELGNDMAAYHFYDMPIADGEVMLAGLPASTDSVDQNYTIRDADGTNISPDSILTGDKLHGVQVTVDSDSSSAVAAGSGSYTYGDFVSVCAYSFEEKAFEGWYDKAGNLISTDQWYCFPAESNTAMTARFGDASGGGGETKPEPEPEPEPIPDGNYDIRMDSLRGDGYSWIYTNETDLFVMLDAENLTGKTDWTIRWEVGICDKETGIITDINEGGTECYTVNEGGTSIVLHGDKLLANGSPLQAWDWMEVRATVFVNGEQKDCESAAFQIREVICEYSYPSWGTVLPMQNISVSSWETIRARIQNADNPEGIMWSLQVTDVTVQILEGAEDAVTMFPWDGNNGWTLHTNSPGHALITLKYNQIDGTPAEPYTCDLWVAEEIYNLDTKSSTGTEQLLPGGSLVLTTAVSQECYSPDRWYYRGTADNLVMGWNCEDDMITVRELSSQRLEDGTLTARYQITADETTKPGDSAIVHLMAYYADENGNIVMDGQGTPKIAVSEDYVVRIWNSYYSVEPISFGGVLAAGEEREINPCLKKYISVDSEPVEITENIRYSWRWNMNSVQITDSDGKIMDYTTSDRNDISGKGPFKIKRLTDWDDISIKLMAEMVDQNGYYQIVAEREWLLTKPEIPEPDDAEHVHTPGNWVITREATCTAAGEKNRYCTKCNAKTEVMSINALGHSWDSGKVTKEATCTGAGEKTYTCSRCKKTKTESIEATGHSYGSSYTVDKAATCTSAGNKSKHCTKCDAKTGVTSIPALGHSYGSSYTVDKAATCTSAGSKSRHCTKCDIRTEVTSIPALAHSWNSGNVTKKATCTTAGEKVYTCTRAGCGATKKEIVKATGHSYSSTYTVDKAATCTSAGSKSKHCTKCDAKTAEMLISAVGHSWNSGKITKAATCTKTGVKTYTCTRTGCGGTKTETIKAAGHKWSAWKTTAEATVLSPAQQIRTCSVCKDTETRTTGKKLTATMKLTANSLKMKVKQSTNDFKVTGMAAGDSLKSVKSGNTKILSVSNVKSTGTFKLTAQNKTGTATLTITLKSGLSRTVKVTVQKDVVKTTKITVPSSKISLKKGKKVTLEPIITPVTSQQKITYRSSDAKIASVSSKGVITAKKKGTAKVILVSGSKIVIVTVTVK